ncbi:ABC-type multidrug transport system fused ATPase/permease subunit [Actinoplanes campanulatus]|uniref:ABC transporter n=1 Tax=Actinoplanes campanulatus TaxID=113559 RepID=A0A7W5AJY7_9ACTN|nr:MULTISPECIES: ABC transporter ATP-binding protein [Actinoplanes]MBB3097476.1 ABC-type multidrug transport system fused ATPase/permease subunit [Actinoplanes campanulatus]GGN27073.1 ABC transporter [Actinoplanes campanulatus]GID38062.1 ABC transporter [Actinoplanes campanulatus]GID45619.1 ABC transporter [Actinoplanes capillaceus]
MRRLPVTDPGTPDSRSAARYLFWLVRRSRLTVAAAALLAIAWMGCQALVPALVGRAVDAAVTRDAAALLAGALLLLGVGVVQALTGITRHRFAVTNWLAAAFRTVQVVVRQANRLGSTLPRRLDAGEVVAIGTSDITHIGGAVDITSRGAGSLLAVVTITVVLLRTSVPLGLIVLVGVPLLMLVVGLLIRPLHRRQKAYRESQGRLTGRAADLVGGLRVLRGVGGESTMAARYRAESQALRAAGVRTARVESLLEAAQVLLPGAFLVLVTWLGARFAADGRITVGQLVSFYAYAAFLVAPLRQLTDVLDKMTRGHVSSRRVVAMLQVEGDLPDPPEPVPLPSGELADSGSGVRIPPGRLTAIVASTPADAARIADRLGRYADGATMNGVPLSAVALAEVRDRILVVDNDAHLFSGRLGSDLDPDGRGGVARALAAAGATDIVDALPNALDTVTADRGRSFSGGQQQRLRLARALIADPEVLILVEPTNAVDAHTEARIAERLRAARSGRTTVVCTSSPLVLSRTDHVCYVEDGRLVAAGRHRDLLRGEPGYARMVLREEKQ